MKMSNQQNSYKKQRIHMVTAVLLAGTMLLTGCGEKDTSMQSMDFSSIGSVESFAGIQALKDDPITRGYCSSTGYYRTVPNEKDGSQTIQYTDFATEQEIVLCSQLNCKHDSEACTAWLPTSQARNMVVPVGDKVVVLRGGNPNFFEILGDASLAQVELMNPDGTDRQVIHQFSATERVPGMPRGGFARDSQNLYFTIESIEGGPRTVYAANIETKQVTALYEMVEEESRIVGGVGTDLVLEYTPGAANMSLSGEDLVTHVVRFNSESKTATPLFEHCYIDVGACVDGKYILLQTDGMIRTYDLNTGEILQQVTVQLPDSGNYISERSMGFYDGKLMVYAEVVQTVDDEEIWQMLYLGIDSENGAVTPVEWRYQDYFGDDQIAQIVAETDTHFLVQTGIESRVVTMPDLEGKKYDNRSDVQKYGLISKEDFWANRGEITPIVDVKG